jgi:hypothetical protein
MIVMRTNSNVRQMYIGIGDGEEACLVMGFTFQDETASFFCTSVDTTRHAPATREDAIRSILIRDWTFTEHVILFL